ncbi:SRPBCC family protein [Nocardia puris]|nr:hypothetical protein [Nocardia puris]MBF6209708.1 SRPBCC family protein [Nocardia puris]MBF6366280.1 SRPBCC family protein [Nocardia puris]MBF6458381.1 SRPBCC family protein [Nocardia puris]
MRGRWVVAAAAIGGAVALHLGPGRRYYATWGATEEETVLRLPGDEMLPDADLVTTRAIGVRVPPAAVWPWLVQFGPGRGGAYTYDWIENLFGLGMHSADEILPEFQSLSIGDSFALGKNGQRMWVRVLDPERCLVFGSGDGTWIWSFALRGGAEGTRLISRNRIRTPGRSAIAAILYAAFMPAASLVMERKMLLGIKKRAERTGAGGLISL